MEQKVILDNLVLCITRRCNLECAHCVRGNTQDVDMHIELMDKILRGVKSISSVTFTGGEPTLNIGIIRVFMLLAKKYNIDLGSFYVVTNGTKESKELIHLLIDLYALCYEKESCNLVVSRDQFHRYEGTIGDLPLYEALRFYDAEAKAEDLKDEWIVNNGRAAENGLGGQDREPSEPEIEMEYCESGTLCIREITYIGATGNVLTCCDQSYNDEEDLCIGNIYEKTLYEIYASYLPVE